MKVIIWELDADRLLTKSCEWLNPYLLNNPRVRDGDPVQESNPVQDGDRQIIQSR